MKRTIFLIFPFILTNCSSDSEFVKQREWKYGSGFWMGDWLLFNDSEYFKIQTDTLFKQDTARAVIVDIDEQLGGDTELTIKSITTGELGTYHEK